MLTAIPVVYWSHYEEQVYEQAKRPENVVEKEIKGLDDLRKPPKEVKTERKTTIK